MKRVLAIGSCRVFRPLRAAHQAGLVELVNISENWWFTHTSAGGLQYTRALAGFTDIPEALRPLTCETMIDPLPLDLENRDLLDVDVVVQEVSAVKLLLSGGVHLNQARVWGHADALGINTARLVAGDTSELPEDDVLQDLQVGLSTFESVRSDVEAVAELVGAPVVCVDHLYSLMSNGKVASDRAAITGWLHRLAAEEVAPVVSTKDYILRAGPASLLDQNHWAQDHELPFGREIVSAFP